MTDHAGNVRLSDVAQVIPGTSPSGRDINDRGEGLPFYQGAKEFGTRHPRPERFTTAPVKTAAVGDILLSVRAPVGRVNVADTACAIGRGVMAVRPRDPADGPYIAAFLQMMGEAWDAHATDGTMFANLSKVGLEQLPVRWPLMRHKVAEVLGALDDRIESLGRLIDESLNMSEAHFDALTADHEMCAYSNALQLKMGHPVPGEDFCEPGEGRPLVRIRDLKTFEPQVWTRTTGSGLPEVVPGDVLVGMDGEFRSVLWLGKGGLLNQRVCSFAPEQGVARAFALFAVRPDLAFCEFSNVGTTVAHLLRSHIDRFTVPDLSREKHAVLQERTETLIEAAIRFSCEAHEARQTRDFLLPRLISGELRVAAAEELVEAAT